LLFVAVSVAATSTERLETTAGASVIDIATESSGLWLVVNRANPCGQKRLTKLDKIALGYGCSHLRHQIKCESNSTSQLRSVSKDRNNKSKYKVKSIC
jgi:hypothetical protein